MKFSQNIPSEKKLTIVYKMEPGCLGPAGPELIEEYCHFAQQKIETIDSNFVNWMIQPRFDKSLPEIQYLINGKELKPAMVKKYLALFDREIDNFEEQYNDKLMDYIDQFLNR